MILVPIGRNTWLRCRKLGSFFWRDCLAENGKMPDGESQKEEAWGTNGAASWPEARQQGVFKDLKAVQKVWVVRDWGGEANGGEITAVRFQRVSLNPVEGTVPHFTMLGEPWKSFFKTRQMGSDLYFRTIFSGPKVEWRGIGGGQELRWRKRERRRLWNPGGEKTVLIMMGTGGLETTDGFKKCLEVDLTGLSGWDDGTHI